MTVAAIIQARLGSTRLPAKVLLPLPTGEMVIEEVLHRCREIKGVDTVVLAIPDTPENDILEHIARRMIWVTTKDASRPVIVRGPEHDVLSRYVKAAEAVDADIIMRVTADCPLIDPEVCGKVLSEFIERKVDYASNVERRSYPQGFDCQVVGRYLLDWADKNATEPYDREHVFTIFDRTAFNKINVSASPDRSHIRWTLDTIEDYVTIWSEFKRREYKELERLNTSRRA